MSSSATVMSSSATFVSSSAATQKDMFRQLEYLDVCDPETEERRQVFELLGEGSCIVCLASDGSSKYSSGLKEDLKIVFLNLFIHFLT